MPLPYQLSHKVTPVKVVDKHQHCDSFHKDSDTQSDHPKLNEFVIHVQVIWRQNVFYLLETLGVSIKPIIANVLVHKYENGKQ